MSTGTPEAASAPEIRTLEPFSVVGLHRTMSMARHAIPELWRDFRSRAAEVGGRSSDDWISLRIYDGLEGRPPRMESPFEQWAAVPVETHATPPDGMARHRLEGGPYAVFTYRGAARDFGPVIEWFHGSWLPASEWEVDDRAHFEILPSDYAPTDPGATEEVWIPVRRRA